MSKSKNNEIKNVLLRTVIKLYQGSYPTQNIKLAHKNKKVLGSRFLSIEKDNDSTIEPLVRRNLDDFYKAANEVEVIDFSKSPTFFPSRVDSFYPFEKAREEIRKDNSIKTVFDYKERISMKEEWREDYYRFPLDPVYYEEFKGWPDFTGRCLLLEIIEKLEEEFVRISKEKHSQGFCRIEVIQEFTQKWGKYFKPCGFNKNSNYIDVWKGEKASSLSVTNFSTSIQSKHKLEWRQYWREDKVIEFFNKMDINSEGKIQSLSKNGSLPKGIPTKSESFQKHYKRDIKSFYNNPLSSLRNENLYEEDELWTMVEFYINKFGIYRTEELGMIRCLSEDSKFPPRIAGRFSKKSGLSGSEIIKKYGPKNIASIKQCSDLILEKGIKNEEEWNKEIQKLNSEKLWYPCCPCDYYFNSCYSPPDKDTSIKYKEILLTISNNIETHKKLCSGNKEDVKEWMKEKDIKETLESKIKKNPEFLNHLPYWVPSKPSNYYNVPFSYWTGGTPRQIKENYVAIYKGEYCTTKDLCSKLSINKVMVTRIKKNPKKNIYGIEFL